MKRNFLLLGGIVTAGTLWAAEPAGPSISAPILGYLFDGTAKAIRAISGIPGAAVLGEPVNSSNGLADAWVHSGARVAVAVTKDGELALVSWGSSSGSAVRTTKLDSSVGTPGRVSFSRNGGFAAVSNGSVVEVWSTGVQPALLSRTSANAFVTAVAVNNDGKAAAAATSDGNIALGTGSDAQTVGSGGVWTALAFRGSELLAIDASRGELVRFADSGRAVLAALPASAHSIANSSGEDVVAAYATGLLVVAASGSTQFACDCQPLGLDELTGGAVLLRGTTLVFDASGPRLMPLPNLVTAAAGGNNQ